MAEETTQNAQTATDNSAVEVKEDSVKTPFVYYYSDPDATDPQLHHLEIPSFVDITKSADGLPWHWHTEKPSEDLVDAIWSNDVNGWVENSKNAQTDIIAQAQQAITKLNAKGEELDKKNEQVDQTLQEVQQVQMQTSQQSSQLMQQFMAQSKATNEMMKSLQATMTTLSASVAQSQQASTEQPATDETKEETK